MMIMMVMMMLLMTMITVVLVMMMILVMMVSHPCFLPHCSRQDSALAAATLGPDLFSDKSSISKFPNSVANICSCFLFEQFTIVSGMFN